MLNIDYKYTSFQCRTILAPRFILHRKLEMNPGQPSQAGGTIKSSIMRLTGVQTPVLDEIRLMSSYFLLIFLVLVSVYVSRIPESVYSYFRSTWVQALGFVGVVAITWVYGPIHGILAALAFALVLSHALRSKPTSEGFTEYTPAVYISGDGDSTIVIPKNHRWFGEKVLGERPQLIREKQVNTSAVQDLSERTMGTGASNVSR